LVLLIGFLLVAVTLVAFWQVLGHDFISDYDDDHYGRQLSHQACCV
jgi:hypothetical protein